MLLDSLTEWKARSERAEIGFRAFDEGKDREQKMMRCLHHCRGDCFCALNEGKPAATFAAGGCPLRGDRAKGFPGERRNSSTWKKKLLQLRRKKMGAGGKRHGEDRA